MPDADPEFLASQVHSLVYRLSKYLMSERSHLLEIYPIFLFTTQWREFAFDTF
jgi:hypothetical protein